MNNQSIPPPSTFPSSPSSSSSSPSSRNPASSNSTPYTLTIPTSLLVIPSTAAVLGLTIGITRGGSRARLRFLAENAHRPPKTVQGWYFYTKTRNYKIFYAALKSGGRYALALGGTSTAYIVLEESIGYLRERIWGVGLPVLELDGEDERAGFGKRVSWRRGESSWVDGSAGGGILGGIVGGVYRLPRPLFIRAILMGIIMGGTASGMQGVLARFKREEVEKQRTERAEALSKASEGRASGSIPSPDVDRIARPGDRINGIPVDVTRAEESSGIGGRASWRDSFTRWIPGYGKG